MIKNSDLEKLAKDIAQRLKQDVKAVIYELKDLKNDSLKIFLKYLRSTNLYYSGSEDEIVAIFEFQIRGKRSSIQFLAQLITLEHNLRKNIEISSEEQRTHNFSNATTLETSNATIKYFLEENENEAEVNETDNNTLDYQKNYTMNVLFKIK